MLPGMGGRKDLEKLSVQKSKKLFAAAAAVYLLFAVALLYTYIPDEITVSGSTENLKLDIPPRCSPIKESGDMEASSAVKASERGRPISVVSWG